MCHRLPGVVEWAMSFGQTSGPLRAAEGLQCHSFGLARSELQVQISLKVAWPCCLLLWMSAVSLAALAVYACARCPLLNI